MTGCEQFLTGQFAPPACPGGDLWGDAGVRLKLPAAAAHVRGVTGMIATRLHSLFPASTEFPALSLSVYPAPASGFRDFDRSGWEATFSRRWRGQTIELAGYCFCARIEFKAQVHISVWTSSEDPREVEDIVHNLLRMGLAYHLLNRGGLLVHSACISDGVNSLLAFGHSGAGKSTLARDALSQGLSVLSDDLNVLLPMPEHLPDQRGWLVLSSPFCGDLPVNLRSQICVPLGGVYRLDQAASESVASITPGVAAAALASCCPYVNEDPNTANRLLEVVAGLCSRVPTLRWGRRRGEVLNARFRDDARKAVHA